MHNIAALLIAALGSVSAHATITALSIPPGAAGSFSALSASGSHLLPQPAGAFDDSWLITLDSSNPAVLFHAVNDFNPSNGGGALNMSVTISGPSLGPVNIPGYTVSISQFSAQRVFDISFSSLGAGLYTFQVFGSNPFNGAYRMSVAVIPEPATAALMGLGMLMLLAQAGRRDQAV